MKNSSLSRRKFLKIVGAGTCGAAIHTSLAPVNSLVAYAMPPIIGAALGQGSVLVVLNLDGGCSHNIAPGYSGAYRDRFPTLSFSEAQSLPLNTEQGLHPALTLFRDIYNEGRLAVINQCGLPMNTRSHDQDQTLKFIGAADGRDQSMSASVSGGWAARLTCQMGSIFGGISLGGSNDLISGDCNAPRSFGDLQGFGEDEIRWDERRTNWMKEHRDRVIAKSNEINTDALKFIRSGMDNIQASIQTIQAATSQPLNFTFPNTGLGNSCRDAVRLIAARQLGVQFIYLNRGGFDTHNGEAQSLTGNLTDINNSLTAMVNALKSLGLWQSVTIMTVSEFCRTFENESRGTDHGNAGPMFVMGGKVLGGIKVPMYSAAQIQSMASAGYFNTVEVHYSQMFKEWVVAAGFDAEKVFPKPFAPKTLNLFEI